MPWGPGGLRLLARVVSRSSESDRPRVVAPDGPTGPVDRLLWRYLAALGARLEAATAGSATLLVGQWAVIPRGRTESFFDSIDDVVLGLEPGSAAVVFAPAPLLVDESPGTDHRRRILSGTGGDYVAPLRYVARLPRGLCRFGGRRRMALWVLGESGDTGGARSFTTFGEHSAHALDMRENRALASDVVAALRGGAARRSHAFLRSEHRLTEAVVVKSALALPVTTDVAEDGGDALARLWEKRDASASRVLDGVEVVAAGSAADHSLPWRAATTGKYRPARVITGVRIPAEVFAAGPGGIGVIGPDEVRGRGGRPRSSTRSAAMPFRRRPGSCGVWNRSRDRDVFFPSSRFGIFRLHGDRSAVPGGCAPSSSTPVALGARWRHGPPSIGHGSWPNCVRSTRSPLNFPTDSRRARCA